MGKFIEFAEVLEQKIRQQIQNEGMQPLKNREIPSVNEGLPAGFAWILGQGPMWKSPSSNEKPVLSKGRQAYGVRERPRPPHKFSSIQIQATDLFAKWGAPLDPAFTRHELKKTWRRVAKATHPDHGGSSEAFREAQSAYQTLLTLFI